MTAADAQNAMSLVARAREGNRAALNALVIKVQPTVYKLAQRFLMIPAEAEDATQDILLKIVTRLGQFDGRSQFTTWVYAVAANHLRDLQKRRQAGVSTFSAFEEDLAEGLAASPYRGPDAERLLEEVRIGCTLAMLQCLEPDARLAYILGDIFELDHREAADVLEIKLAAYRKRLSRARDAVTEFMREHCGLFAASNPCRCSKRISRAKELGRVDPDNLVFASSARIAREFPDVLAQMRRLEEARRAAALYRAQKQPAQKRDFLQWFRLTLEGQRDLSGDRVN